MEKKPLILITNDDGYQAHGILVLTRLMSRLGDVIVVAPDGAKSGAGCSITCTRPVKIRKISTTEGVGIFSCDGTPVDCVKIALEKVVPRKPDLLVSGINHGDNASISIHYSGTMGAVLEACMKGIPAIGFSLRTKSKECDFSPYEAVIVEWVEKVLKEGLPKDTCLNINFPEVEKLKGTRICRMARGSWSAEWRDAGADSDGNNLYTLTGYFTNLEPNNQNTDYWALDNGYASIVYIGTDMTSPIPFWED